MLARAARCAARSGSGLLLRWPAAGGVCCGARALCAASPRAGATASPPPAVAPAAQPLQRVLLHSCCAPCSGAMIEEMVGAGHDVTIYFYNPNIHPRAEYEIRKNENKRCARPSASQPRSLSS